MLLEDIYLKSCEEFEKRRFTSYEFARMHKLSLESSKVLIHRLVKNNQLLRAGRGEYVALSAISFLKLGKLGKMNPKLHQLALEFFLMFPELKALMFYGSMVRGGHDRFSDYDVLLILEEKLVDTEDVKKKIENELGIKLHLTIYSQKGYRSAILSEPCLRFWISEGFIFDEAGIFQCSLPPVAKMAYEEWLSTARVYMENAKDADQIEKKCRYYFTALEVIEFIGAALQLVYDFSFVKQRLAMLIGGETVRKIRARSNLSFKEAGLLEKTCKNELSDIEAKMAKIGINEADIYWKSQLSR